MLGDPIERRSINSVPASAWVHLVFLAALAVASNDRQPPMARAIFERVGKAAPVQVVGGLSIAQAKGLAKAGLRAFVISGNLGQPDSKARYDLPPDQIQRFVADFIAGVSGG